MFEKTLKKGLEELFKVETFIRCKGFDLPRQIKWLKIRVELYVYIHTAAKGKKCWSILIDFY
jgi:hypothetical protein